MSLKRQLRTSYRTAWLVPHKMMARMAERDALQSLAGNIQLDNAYLSGEQPGVGGRGSINKVPIVAAVAANKDGQPMRLEFTAMASFTREAMAK